MMKIREASAGDEVEIHRLICELAEYEREPDAVTNTPDLIRKDLFEDRVCEALVVENEDHLIVGFALFYDSYSTWKGRCLYLEDFYIQPEYRRSGIGSKLFQRVIDVAKKKGVKRMDWQVLEWNELAISFYKKQEALLDPEWINGRLFF